MKCWKFYSTILQHRLTGRLKTVNGLGLGTNTVFGVVSGGLSGYRRDAQACGSAVTFSKKKKEKRKKDMSVINSVSFIMENEQKYKN